MQSVLRGTLLIGKLWVNVQDTIMYVTITHQIRNNGFNLALHHLHVFGGTFQGDLIFSLGELNVHLDAKYMKVTTSYN